MANASSSIADKAGGSDQRTGAHGSSDELRAPRDLGPVIRRAMALLLFLGAAKWLMLFDLRQHLFEIHWRLERESIGWSHAAAVFAFASVITLNLWFLGERCRHAGVLTQRRILAGLAGLGLLATLFLLEVDGNSYFGQAMDQAIGWSDAAEGWVHRAFVAHPLIAYWVALYAFSYALCVGLGREPWMWRITSALAGAYVAANLALPPVYHDALWVLTVFGLLCPILSRGYRDPLPIRVLGTLAAGVVLTLAIYYGRDVRLTMNGVMPAFLIVSSIGLAIILALTLIARRAHLAGPWSWFGLFATAAYLMVANGNFLMAGNYSHLLCKALTWPRYFLGEIVLALVFAGGAAAFRQWRPRASWLWIDSAAILLMAWAAADATLTRLMGVRLDWNAIAMGIGDTPGMVWRLSKPYLPILAGGVLLLAAVYSGLLRWLRSASSCARVEEAGDFGCRSRIFLGLLVGTGVAGLLVIRSDKASGQSLQVLARSSPIWRATTQPIMDARKFVETANTLGLPPVGRSSNALQTGAQAAGLNVVLVFQESTYNQHLSLFGGKVETQPLLKQYRDRMEVFPNFFSVFACSIQARFATFTGLYPVRNFREFTLQRVPVKSIFELMADHGYSSSIFYSSFCDYTAFRDFLAGRKIEELYDASTMPGTKGQRQVAWGLREDQTLRAMKNYIRERGADGRKFFMTYIPAAPHQPFDGAPARFRQFDAKGPADFVPMYHNELLHMDWVISSVLDELADAGLLEKTLIVITADHGEMLGINGGPIGHGWAVTPELANVPLIILDPRKTGYRVNPTIGSQVDLLPTLADKLGFDLPAEQLYQGCSLYSAGAQQARTIYINSMQEYVVLEGDRLTWGDRESSNTKTYRIRNQDELTRFFLIDAPPASQRASIESFDAFQEGFLRRYAGYCESVGQFIADQPPNRKQVVRLK